jgi:hypothetical protein
VIPALCLSAAKFFVCGELAGVPLINIYYRHSIVLTLWFPGHLGLRAAGILENII